MWDLIVAYGPKVLYWVLAMLGGLVAKYVVTLTKNAWAQGVISRAYAEIDAAVKHVAQVYVDAIKAGSADGQLTDAEKANAKQMAIDTFKANFGGAAALKTLARVLGLADVAAWVDSKVEAAVLANRPR